MMTKRKINRTGIFLFKRELPDPVMVIIVMILILSTNLLFSQGNHSNEQIIADHDRNFGTGFNQTSDLSSGKQLKFPWAGGLNSCQFCPIDMNLDGIKDLLVFDRHGNRKLTFINHGKPNTVDYTIAPAFSGRFPELHDWVITADYNCDGKMDIFTYGMGGIRVFRNVSDTSLKFSLVTNLLESYYYSGYVGLLVTDVDYPAIADIDGDGDLDILTFFGFGSYVEYHKNLSMEKYGNCDSLDFRLSDHCWGKFKESGEGNHITLNAGCPFEITNDDLRFTNDDLPFWTIETGFVIRHSEFGIPKARHTGSTLLATDLNNDGLVDLILGDVDYPRLVALYNGGTRDSAFMVEQDTAFPANTSPVHLFSFPVVSHLDIDNDGLTDLVVSPFDPALQTSDNYNCVWYYKNTGSNALPHFELQPEQLFRNEMMDFGSASHPVLYDFDGDGLKDLFVGNDGMYDSSYYKDAVLHSVYTSEVACFKNTGTLSSPVFSYVTDDLAGISGMGMRGAYPALADLDGDGHTDLLIGSSDGTLIFFKNSGGSSGVPAFNPPVMNWQGIDVGEYSAPQMFDLDKDDKPDLIIGEQNGNLNYYKNTGTVVNAIFSFVTDSLGKVNVTNYNVSYTGFSTPCFSRLPDGSTILLAGSEEGRIHLFENIDNNLDGKFTDSGGLYTWLSSTPADTLFGWQTSPAIAHLSDPVEFDLLTGNFSGGLNYITMRTPAEIIPGIAKKQDQNQSRLVIFPNPADLAVTIRMPWPGNTCIVASDGVSSNPAFPSIQLFNFVAQKILDIPFSGSINISTKDLPAGIYLIRCGNASGKLVIEHL